MILKQLFNLYKTKKQNMALFVKISILVWASSNPMGQVQNTPRLPLGQVTVSVLFLTLPKYMPTTPEAVAMKTYRLGRYTTPPFNLDIRNSMSKQGYDLNHFQIMELEFWRIFFKGFYQYMDVAAAFGMGRLYTCQ